MQPPQVRNKDFSGATFSHSAQFYREYIDCSFDGATLQGSTLFSKFYRCSFVATKLREVYLSGAKFHKCNFKQTCFEKASFYKTTFSKCDFAFTSFTDILRTVCCTISDDCTGLWTIVGAIAVRETGLGEYQLRVPGFVKPTRGLLGPAKKTTIIEGPVEEKTAPLPVAHYRSPPEEKNSTDAADTTYMDDEHCVNMYAYGDWRNYRANTDKYGYGKTAVLECADISEYRKLNNSVRQNG